MTAARNTLMLIALALFSAAWYAATFVSLQGFGMLLAAAMAMGLLAEAVDNLRERHESDCLDAHFASTPVVVDARDWRDWEREMSR